MEPVRARDVSLNGRQVSGRWYETGALSMGFSWSLYFAQAVNEHALHEVEGIQDVSVMNDRTHPCVLDISNPGQVFGCPCRQPWSTLSLDLHRPQRDSSHFKTSSVRWVADP